MTSCNTQLSHRLFASVLVIISVVVPAAFAAPPKEVAGPAETALHKTIANVNFKGVAVSDAFDFLRDISGVKFDVNWDALEKAGVTKKTPLSIDAKDLKLSAVLDRLLADVHAKEALVYAPDGDSVRISTEADLKSK